MKFVLRLVVVKAFQQPVTTNKMMKQNGRHTLLLTVALILLILVVCCTSKAIPRRKPSTKQNTTIAVPVTYCTKCTESLPTLEEKRRKTCESWGTHSSSCASVTQTYELSKRNCHQQCELYRKHEVHHIVSKGSTEDSIDWKQCWAQCDELHKENFDAYTECRTSCENRIY
jgi:hypothetical protein